MNDSYHLVTPENVEFSYDVAGLGSRFVAALVDALIQGVLFVLVGVSVLVATGAVIGLMASLAAPNPAALVPWMIGGGLLLLFLVLWGYYIFFELAWNGQSPGKRLVGIRVIKDDGYPPGFLDSVVRNLVRAVDFLPAYYVIGITTMLLNRRWKRLGDYVAGTVVVKERSANSLDQLLSHAPSRNETPLPCASRLTAPDYNLVREFLVRRASLPTERRHAVAAELAGGLARRLECDAEGLDAETFLEALAAGYRKD